MSATGQAASASAPKAAACSAAFFSAKSENMA